MICPARPPDYTLSEFLGEVYIPSRIRVTEDWIQQIRYAIRKIDAWHGQPVRISDLTEPFLRGFLSAYSKKVSAATVNGKRGCLLALWHCAWEEGLLGQPPRRRMVRRLDPEQRVPEAWTTEEIGRILRACKGCRGEICGIPASLWWRSILLIAYYTGERRGALLATTPDQIDMQREAIVFRHTKTHRERWCSLPPDAIGALTPVLGKNARVWPWDRSLKALHERLVRILRRAKVASGRSRGGVWHKFRRTSGSLVEAAGGDGAAHLGNTRAVFNRHYRDPRMFHSSVSLLQRPN